MSKSRMGDEAELELAQFRSQWQQEVTQRARHPNPQASSSAAPAPAAPAAPAPAAGPSKRRPAQISHVRTKSHVSQEAHSDDEATPPVTNDAFNDPHIGSSSGATSGTAPKSAMEHFEKAIEREGQGNLGDSLNLYRKAYRMDPKIDTKYREKYFPRVPVPTSTNPQAPSTSVNTAHHSSHAPTHSGGYVAAPGATTATPATEPLTTNSLIASFSNLRIQANPLPTFTSSRKAEKAPESTTAAEPEPESEPERGFSLLARLPHELLLHILRDVANLDIASFARCALVCKSLAFTIATEDSIWKDACLHPKWGFPGQVWDWKCGVLGEDLPDLSDEEEEEEEDGEISDPEFSVTQTPRPESPPPIKLLLPNYRNSYKTMFSTRPRIRYNGLYISTCNYIRPGAFHSSAHITGAAPVHIVTYYRYLRFYPDGTCLSLLTTHEPPEVVYHLSKPNTGNQGYSSGLHPWGKHVLRGRWRLDPRDSGNVDIETESASREKYLFKMGLGIKSAGAGGKSRGGQRLNKLVWRGFWSWNKLTDDVAEFSLRNDKPYFWSRVGRFDREVLGVAGPGASVGAGVSVSRGGGVVGGSGMIIH